MSSKVKTTKKDSDFADLPPEQIVSFVVANAIEGAKALDCIRVASKDGQTAILIDGWELVNGAMVASGGKVVANGN